MHCLKSSTREQRQHRRYGFDVEVFVSWVNTDGSVIEQKGRSADISASGVALVTDADLSIGMEIRLNLYVPPSTPMGRFSTLYGEGVVVRVVPCGGTLKFVAARVCLEE